MKSRLWRLADRVRWLFSRAERRAVRELYATHRAAVEAHRRASP